MDILTIIDESAWPKLSCFEITEQLTGTVFRARFDAPRRSGAPATKYLELRVEPLPANKPRMRWRSGYLYNHTAIFWDVPDAHRAVWAALARHIALRVRDAAIENADAAYNALSRLSG